MKALRKSDIKEINNQISIWNIELTKKDAIQLDDQFKPPILLVNGTTAFFHSEDQWIPTLKYLSEHDMLKKITVDMGAVIFMAKGADVMRPGITKIDDDIQKGDFVVIVDEKHEKGLAVGKTLYTSEDMQQLQTGKVILNIHYVGDAIWNYVS